MRKIDKIIMEEIDAVAAFNDINKRNPLTPWDPETRMDRMNPGNAARVKGGARFSKGKAPKYHSYQDWLDNYKPDGISWDEYNNMELD